MKFADLRSQLIYDEGKLYVPYKDSVGVVTVGVGRNLQDVPFSEDEVQLMLTNDIARARRACRNIFVGFDGFSQARQDALANMAFTLGEKRLRTFTHMVAAINRGDWAQAAAEAHNSKWFDQVGQRAVRIITAFGEET